MENKVASESKMIKWLKSKKGKSAIDKLAKEIAEREKKLDYSLRSLKRKFNASNPSMKDFITQVVKENIEKIEYCNKHSNGYEIVKEGKYKGEYCDITPTESFDLLFEYFRRNGSDSFSKFNQNFLSESYEIDAYYLNLYQGQGCFYRLYKGKKKVILQI